MKFPEIVNALNRERIDFFVTGSFAVYLYTLKRDFNDIDVVVKASDLPRVEKLFGTEIVRKISHFNEEYSSISVGIVEFCDFNIKRGEENYFFGLDQDYKEYPYFKYDGCEFRVIDPEELIVLKIVFNRRLNGKRDLDDAVLLIKSLKLDWIKLIIQSYKHGVYNNLIELLQVPELKTLKITI